MAVSLNPQFLLSVVETLTGNVDAAESPQVTHSGFNLTGVRLNASSTPPATKVSAVTHALTAGAKTIDLTVLPGTEGNQDCTGLKLQLLLLENPAGNAAITIGKGASNGYALFGTTNTVTVAAAATQAGYLAFFFPEGLPDVAAGAKTIDVSGTGTQEFNLILVLG